MIDAPSGSYGHKRGSGVISDCVLKIRRPVSVIRK